jgi:hypothetical protein
MQRLAGQRQTKNTASASVCLTHTHIDEPRPEGMPGANPRRQRGLASGYVPLILADLLALRLSAASIPFWTKLVCVVVELADNLCLCLHSRTKPAQTSAYASVCDPPLCSDIVDSTLSAAKPRIHDYFLDPARRLIQLDDAQHSDGDHRPCPLSSNPTKRSTNRVLSLVPAPRPPRLATL